MKNKKKEKYVGRKIIRKQALRGLGDPKKWEAEAKKLDREFRKKPKKGGAR